MSSHLNESNTELRDTARVEKIIRFKVLVSIKGKKKWLKAELFSSYIVAFYPLFISSMGHPGVSKAGCMTTRVRGTISICRECAIQLTKPKDENILNRNNNKN